MSAPRRGSPLEMAVGRTYAAMTHARDCVAIVALAAVLLLVLVAVASVGHVR